VSEILRFAEQLALAHHTAQAQRGASVVQDDIFEMACRLELLN
jgi:hypothetical protein